MQMRKTLAIAAVLSGLSLVGCGSSRPADPVAGPLAPTVAQACPPGHAQMGCSLRTADQGPLGPHNPLLKAVGAPAGGLIPDVSSWQGLVNWVAVANWQTSHGWKRAAIFKLGEYTLDPFATRNAAETARLGFWHAGYWFLRNTGCSHEEALIAWAAKRYGLTVVVLDAEVPEAAGYTTCLVPSLRRAGFLVVIYTGTGTWPGGNSYNSPLWVASYGSGFGCIWTCNPVAWQFTDGHSGSVRGVPGIGFGDVSVDRGITKLGVALPPKQHCLRARFPHTKTCYLARYRDHAVWRDLTKVENRLRQHGCSNRRHPSYCAGWQSAARGDRVRLSALQHQYA